MCTNHKEGNSCTLYAHVVFYFLSSVTVVYDPILGSVTLIKHPAMDDPPRVGKPGKTIEPLESMSCRALSLQCVMGLIVQRFSDKFSLSCRNLPLIFSEHKTLDWLEVSLHKKFNRILGKYTDYSYL